MLLAVEPFSGFAGLLQVILLILAAFLTAAFVVTVIMHYRKRKHLELEPDALQQIVAASPESTAYLLEDEYVLFDHSGLIKDYKTRLVNNHAKYNALKQDFEELEDRYNSLILQQRHAINNSKSNIMEQPNAQQFSEENQTASLTHDHEMEREELIQRLNDLNSTYLALKLENEEMARVISGEETRESMLQNWKEENSNLKNRLADLEYLKDLVDEKKSQIDFLQNQLEQRIRNYHQAERQLADVNEQLRQTLVHWNEAKADLGSARAELESLQEQFGKVTSSLQQEQGSLASKQDQITYLENTLREIREQNELLNAALGDQQEKNNNLSQLLEDEQSRRVVMEQKLASNKQLLQRLYKEFSACMEGQTEDSPVVPLRPAYISTANAGEWEESAVQ